MEVKEGELKSFDPMRDRIDCAIITDPTKRNLAKTIGYYGNFELTNGFEKSFYMSLGEMELHADKFSAAFKLKTYREIQSGKIPQSDMWKYSSFWYKDFDTMAKKTILRRMLSSGYAPLSVEMINAIDADEKRVVAHEDGTQEYTEIPDDAKDISPEVQQEPEEVEAGDPFAAIEQAGGSQLDLDTL
jgi:recombination protein RecT